MFYEEDQISKALVCPKCRGQFSELNEPRILLCCSETICTNCIDGLVAVGASEELDSPIKCKLCNDSMEIPAKGFPVNKTVLKLIESKPKEVYRGKYIELLKNKIIQLRSQINELRGSETSNRVKLKIYCDYLRDEILVATESAIDSINRFSNELLKKIELYELECQRHFESEKVRHVYENLESFLGEMKQFCDKCETYLKNSDVNDEEILRAIDLVNEKQPILAKEKSKQSNLIFNSRLLKYKENEKMIQSKVLGFLFYDRTGSSSINFNELRQIDFNRYLSNKHSSHAIDLICLDNDNFLLVYVNILNISLLHFLLLDSKGNLLQSLDVDGNFYFRKLTAHKNRIVFHSYTTDLDVQLNHQLVDEYFLQVIDATNLKRLYKNSTNSNRVGFLSVAASDERIVCLAKNNCFHFYSWSLDFIEKMELEDFPDLALSFRFRNDKLYVRTRVANQIVILNPKTLKKIEIMELALNDDELGEKTYLVDSNEKLIFLNRRGNKLIYFNADGVIENELLLSEFPADSGLNILLDRCDNVLFVPEHHNLCKFI